MMVLLGGSYGKTWSVLEILECFRLIIGDFNVVKSPCEKLGGNVSGHENDFLQYVNSLEIDDYPAVE